MNWKLCIVTILIKKKLLVYQNVITSYIVSQGDLVTINLILHWHLYFIFLMKMCMYSALWLLIYLFKQNHAIKFVVVLYIFYLKTTKKYHKIDRSFIYKKIHMKIWFYYGIHRLDRFIYLLAISFWFVFTRKCSLYDTTSSRTFPKLCVYRQTEGSDR